MHIMPLKTKKKVTHFSQNTALTWQKYHALQF
jgi:hypothetical protein